MNSAEERCIVLDHSLLETFMARLVSLIVLTVLIVFLGITFFQVIAPFLLPLFLAGVIALLCQPLFHYFLAKTNHNNHWAAGLTTALIILIIFVPLSVGTFIATVELYSVAQDQFEPHRWRLAYQRFREQYDTDRVIDGVFESFNPRPVEDKERSAWEKKRTQFHEKLETNLRANIKAALSRIAERTVGYAASTLGFLGRLVAGLIGLMMFIIGLYYFLADGPNLLAASRELIPVNQDYQSELLTRFNTVVNAVVLATFAAALGQGIATAMVLYFFVGHFFLLSILCTLTALIPLIGTWLIWGPVAIWLLSEGHWGQALMLTAYGTIFIGTLDNVIRTYVLHTDAKLHPLLAFVSVLGGLQAMGLWGIFVGPIVASCLHALVKIFNTELKAFSEEKFARVKRPAGNRGGKRSSGRRGRAKNRSEKQTEAQPASQKENIDATGSGETNKPRRRRRKRKPRGPGPAPGSSENQ